MKSQSFIRYVIVMLFLMARHLDVFSQTASNKQTFHNNQIWLGYVTSAKISQRYSVWNDVHYVPESFFIIRTGLTRHLDKNLSLTAGYAFLKTAAPDLSLTRTEHRPWSQIQNTNKFARTWGLTQRVRYDARFRQEIKDGSMTDDFIFNHRIRFLLSLRKDFGGRPDKQSHLYAVLSDELLLNYGRQVSSGLDQNRLAISLGIQKENIQYQLGVMNRLVQGTTGRVLNHTLVLWVSHKLNFIHRHEGDHVEATGD
jgi:hypothetical protein